MFSSARIEEASQIGSCKTIICGIGTCIALDKVKCVNVLFTAFPKGTDRLSPDKFVSGFVVLICPSDTEQIEWTGHSSHGPAEQSGRLVDYAWDQLLINLAANRLHPDLARDLGIDTTETTLEITVKKSSIED